MVWNFHGPGQHTPRTMPGIAQRTRTALSVLVPKRLPEHNTAVSRLCGRSRGQWFRMKSIYVCLPQKALEAQVKDVALAFETPHGQARGEHDGMLFGLAIVFPHVTLAKCLVAPGIKTHPVVDPGASVHRRVSHRALRTAKIKWYLSGIAGCRFVCLRARQVDRR